MSLGGERLTFTRTNKSANDDSNIILLQNFGI
jgi:hypothetical protein